MRNSTVQSGTTGQPGTSPAPRVGRMRRATAVLAGPALGAIPLLGTTPAAAADPFPVFVNERGADRPTLEQFGSTRSTVVYDVFAFTCTATSCTANGGALPTQAVFEAKVKEYMGANQFGGAATAPVVLDFEDIELTQVATGAAATHAYNLWRTLLTWTHNAAPSAPVCHYGYDWLTQNQALIKQLHDDDLLNCFAPRAYFYTAWTQAEWDQRLDEAVTHDRTIAPDHPIYPYVNPTTIENGAYVSGNTWAHMFEQVKAKADGVIVWEPTAADSTACNWVAQHSYEMGVITGTGSSGPLKATATPPSGNCTVRRGTTVSVPVAFANTSTTATAATALTPVSGATGITGTWASGTVPALAPGATYATTLSLTVAPTRTAGTALLHLKTGLSDTRMSVIVLN
ncbi:hypothetical protein [uncultured Streptomyces sp.]|uniref:hypothetical protein n=1 Tax=uncultured Streptomyces sp. TaxID=174707 RepID=UPI0026377433|nr:hypothetical protein [uncultured Streptomyces sp.]